MQIAIVAAGFTPSEADGLRRAMATFRHTGNIQLYRDRMIKGMVERGYETNFAERCFKQIEGFGKYGFPESHAASFALLVYASSWLKCHYPAAYAAALLNSQPMGFYKPAQIVRDAQDHGVVTHEIDVNDSEWDCTLELIKHPISILASHEEKDKDKATDKWRHISDQNTCLRLGFRQIKGLQLEAADNLVSAREDGYWQVPILKERAQLKRGALEKLANADCFQSLGLDRRQALWAVNGLNDAKPLPLFAQLPENQLFKEPDVKLPNITLGENVAADYKALRLSLKAHPMALLRSSFTTEKIITCADLATVTPENIVRLAGVVLIRQRPGSAKGVIFITLEDETGIANLIVWPHKMERYRRTVIGSYLLGVEGKLQREGIVTHVLADKLYDFSYRLGYLTKVDVDTKDKSTSPKLKMQSINKEFIVGSRDFH
jgi:error-prone DNA polymerase